MEHIKCDSVYFSRGNPAVYVNWLVLGAQQQVYSSRRAQETVQWVGCFAMYVTDLGSNPSTIHGPPEPHQE